MRARSAYGKVNAQVQDIFQVGRQDRILYQRRRWNHENSTASDERREVWWFRSAHLKIWKNFLDLIFVCLVIFLHFLPWDSSPIEPPFGRMCFCLLFIVLERNSPNNRSKRSHTPLKANMENWENLHFRKIHLEMMDFPLSS